MTRREPYKMGPLIVVIFWAVVLFFLAASGGLTLLAMKPSPTLPRLVVFVIGGLLGLFASLLFSIMILPEILSPGGANLVAVPLGALVSGYLAVRCHDNSTQGSSRRSGPTRTRSQEGG